MSKGNTERKRNITRIVNGFSQKQKIKIAYSEIGIIDAKDSDIILEYNSLKEGTSVFASLKGEEHKDARPMIAPDGNYEIKDKNGTDKTITVKDGKIEKVIFTATDKQKFSQKLRELGNPKNPTDA